MAGPIALVGSGEYLPVMAPIDRLLLEGRHPRVAMLPTAAGLEGPERIAYWSQLGLDHYRTLGIEAVVLPVLNHEDADSAKRAREIEGAGLIYLSGGSPAHLAESLRDTRVLAAIVTAWQRGAALAGCSAGACALSAIAGGFRDPTRPAAPGLRLIPHLAVIPHFDRFDRRDPHLVQNVLDRTPAPLTLIGIDERTALVGGPQEFVVMGDLSAWWIDRQGDRHQFAAGAKVLLEPGEDPVNLSVD